ncbi:MAG TPA: hypothetical protein VKQ30_08550 [Ktedonobacterales bacterium]|nr:hypothetical protein [Ktedonobacterales bacterium]
MGPGSTRARIAVPPIRVRVTAAPTRTADVQRESAWEGRLYAGLRVSRVSPEIRAALTGAMGELGVEAEYFLALLQHFPGMPPYPHERGEAFLLRLEAACHRLMSVAGTLEVATQSYLSALEAAYPELRTRWDTDTWWPLFHGYAPVGEPLELQLRRCGFAYRHVVAAHLASNIEAVGEHLALTLHALTTLPPAGVLPAGSLHQGLYELSSTMQGYIIPHHVADINRQTPGLLTGIAWLRGLEAREDTSLASDIAWAHAQYAFARQIATQGSHSGTPGVSSEAIPAWATAAMRDWQDTIAALERLRGAR